MKVVLLANVDKLGQAGEMVNVKDGYARNLLIPAGMALKADPRNVRTLTAQKQAAQARVLRELKTHQAMAMRLAQTELVAAVQVGEEERMFGAVTSSDISGLLAQAGIAIDRRIIDLPEPIKSLGLHTVTVKLHADVPAQVKIRVIKQET